MPKPQRKFFMSYSTDDGAAAVREMKRLWVEGGHGSSDDFWDFGDCSKQGAHVVAEYEGAIRTSELFVPFLSPSYLGKQHTEMELRIAREVELIRTLNPEAPPFIIPCLANGFDPKDLPKDGPLAHRVFRDVGGTVETLSGTLDRGQAQFTSSPRSLDDWPDRLVDATDGADDVMFVLGHTDKEGKISNEALSHFKQFGLHETNLDEEGTQQSLRPAQMVPALQRYLHGRWLASGGRLREGQLPEYPCELDRHLINYRRHLLETHHLICLGAGDTNWISRCLQRHFHSVLHARFDQDGASQVIVVDACDHDAGKLGKFHLNAVSRSAGQITAIRQVEAGDKHYSAIIAVLPNPWNSEKTAVLCAGLTGLGTLAAVWALVSPDFRQVMRKRRFPHLAVIRGKEKDWMPTGYELVF